MRLLLSCIIVIIVTITTLIHHHDGMNWAINITTTNADNNNHNSIDNDDIPSSSSKKFFHKKELHRSAIIMKKILINENHNNHIFLNKKLRNMNGSSIPPFVRNLQFNDDDNLCTNDGIGVNFNEDDNFALDAFNFLYETVCTCTEEDNQDELDALLEGPGLENITDINAILDTVNEAFNLLEISSQYDCQNGCETCFRDTCGILSTSEVTYIKGANTSVTLEDILLLVETSSADVFDDFTNFLGEVNYQFELCMEYSKPNYGTLCFGANINEIPENIESSSEFECYINLDGVDCNTCILTLGENDAPDCAVADCTNLPEYGATIDTCNDQGLTGPFEIIGIYQDNENPTGFMKGSCDSSNTTTTSPTTSPSTEPNLNLVCKDGQCTFTRVDTLCPGPQISYDGNDTVIYDPCTFSDTTIAPWTDPNNQDKLSDTVAITRDYREGIFNALDPEDQYDKYSAPSGTEWSLLPTGMTFDEARCRLTFGTWKDSFAMGNPQDTIGKPGVVHLIEEDVYYNIIFTQWTSDKLGNGDENPLGGGFQYIRDEVPFSTEDLPVCPVCTEATANPDKITGPIDDSFVMVEVEGVTPENATVTIFTVTQESDPKCNNVRDAESDYTVRPNAMNISGTSVMLRRTRSLGSVNPYWYTIHFLAETEGGTCLGKTRVCVPLPGLSCYDYIDGYDATQSQVCLD